ncbi:MAG: class I SAM-dependent methyltransferase [Crocinitomicaceae bacterium]|nr:class I SAM-dependent methyltransferase [Crocinitomicaceae bacterium]
MSQKKLFTEGWADYELIDAGGGKKLERWGKVITIRPEVQAYFKSEIAFEKWYKMADWEFVQKGSAGMWKPLKPTTPKEWTIGYNHLKFKLSLTKFKHVGLFPEQRTNWDFIEQHLSSADRFLNLFAYTGAASLVARHSGAETLHVDSVKQMITWAKENMDTSRLLNIKWVVDDALKFAKREEKRENKYKIVLMDPPAWGIGAKGEKWKLEEKIDELLSTAASLVQEGGFLIVNTYSPQLTYDDLKELANIYFSDQTYDLKELWMKSTSGRELYFGNLLRIKF